MNAALLPRLELLTAAHCHFENYQLAVPPESVGKVLQEVSNIGIQPSPSKLRRIVRGLEDDLKLLSGSYRPALLRCLFLNAHGLSHDSISDQQWAGVLDRVRSRLVASMSHTVIDLTDEGDEGPAPAVAAARDQLMFVHVNQHSLAVPALKSLQREQYEALDHQTCVDIIMQRDETIAEHVKHERALRRKIASITGKVCAVPEDDDRNIDWMVTRRGKQRLTVKGSIALAIRKSTTNIACQDVGVMIMEDIGKNTVIRAELDLGDRMHQLFKNFHTDMANTILNNHENSSSSAMVTFQVHTFRSDATNSSVWHHSKLINLDFKSYYVVDLEHLTPQTGLASILHTCYGFADLQRVASAATGVLQTL